MTLALLNSIASHLVRYSVVILMKPNPQHGSDRLDLIDLPFKRGRESRQPDSRYSFTVPRERISVEAS